MKKVVAAFAVVAVVVLGVWGYRTVKATFTAPVDLVEANVSPVLAVFGGQTTGDRKADEQEREARTAAVKAVGAAELTGNAIWFRASGKDVRTGTLVDPRDAAKLRKLDRRFRVVAFQGRKGWTTAAANGGGAMAFATLTSRFMLTAMEKAKASGFASYVVLLQFDGKTSEFWLVQLPD